MATTPPHWDLTNVYSDLDSPELTKDIEWVKETTESVRQNYQEKWSKVTVESPHQLINEAISMMLDQTNELLIKVTTIRAYLHSFISTDSFNEKALKLGSQFDMVVVEVQKIIVVLEAWVGKFKEQLPEVLALGNSAGEHAFPVQEIAEQSQYLMSEKEEILQNELSLSSARAWTKLQGTVTSQKTVDFELDGEMKTLPMPALINLHSHPDESVRKRAYETEMAAWEICQGASGSLHERDQGMGEHHQHASGTKRCPACPNRPGSDRSRNAGGDDGSDEGLLPHFQAVFQSESSPVWAGSTSLVERVCTGWKGRENIFVQRSKGLHP